jgi:pimeloyl-ACP methyl ester carboxylesterase
MRTLAGLAAILALAVCAPTALGAAAPVDWSNKTLPPGVSRATIEVAGVKTRIFQAGETRSREAVVFVHGHPGSADDWPHLVAVAGRYGRAIAIDLPGFGEAYDGPKFQYNVASEAKWLADAFAALGIERVHLALHDFGGPIALEWAKAHPDQLISVVLLNTGIFENYYGHPLAYTWNVPTIGEAEMATTTRESFGLVVQSGSLRPMPQAYVDTAWSHYDPATRAAALSLYRSYKSPDEPDKQGRAQAAVLRQKKRPALVIWGETDPFVPVYVAYSQADAFPDADIYTLHAGHWPFVELPDEVDALVDPFWKQNVHIVLPPQPAAKAKKKRAAKKRCAKRKRTSSRRCRKNSPHR